MFPLSTCAEVKTIFKNNITNDSSALLCFQWTTSTIRRQLILNRKESYGASSGQNKMADITAVVKEFTYIIHVQPMRIS